MNVVLPYLRELTDLITVIASAFDNWGHVLYVGEASRSLLYFYCPFHDYIVVVRMPTLPKDDLSRLAPLFYFHDSDLNQLLPDFWRIMHEKT